jgi:hypothetical protein
MKEERNNEIDLLLRRMSGRNGDAAREANLDEQHLDADELSAYAQNALPPGARARYIEHLAECTTCRRLATELSLSLGATAAAQVETVAQPGWLKQFLASLFSPMVLRYAVPALGLIVVAAVGFVVLRQQKGPEFVAQVKTQPTADVPATLPETPAAGLKSQDGSLAEAPKEKEEPGQRPATKPSEPKPEKETVVTDSVSGAAQPLAKADRSDAEPQRGFAGASPAVAGGAAAPGAAKAAPTESERDQKAEEAAKKQPEPATQSVVVRAEPGNDSNSSNFQRAKENEKENAGQTKTRAVPLQSRNSVAGLRPMTGRADADKRAQQEKDEAKDKPNDDAETRSIAGRRFRKERGIWIDTAYDSSTATVNMARGSEQFRALVADEPVIGTIAKQLDGEVIVVWKGHAYRIR